MSKAPGQPRTHKAIQQEVRLTNILPKSSCATTGGLGLVLVNKITVLITLAKIKAQCHEFLAHLYPIHTYQVSLCDHWNQDPFGSTL